MPYNCFITATDTDAGKTYISTLILQGFQLLGVKAAGVKPIAAGTNNENLNGDALLLQQHSGIALPYSVVNPICFDAPVAPHLAAKLQAEPIAETELNQALTQWQSLAVEQLLIEGAGGWLLPLNEQRYLADWVAESNLPVVLVVGMKLGCLNHAMLSVREIERSGCQLIGWVANCIDPDMALQRENIADLRARINAPCLAVIPYSPSESEKVNLSVELAKAIMPQD